MTTQAKVSRLEDIAGCMGTPSMDVREICLPSGASQGEPLAELVLRVVYDSRPYNWVAGFLGPRGGTMGIAGAVVRDLSTALHISTAKPFGDQYNVDLNPFNKGRVWVKSSGVPIFEVAVQADTAHEEPPYMNEATIGIRKMQVFLVNGKKPEMLLGAYALNLEKHRKSMHS